MTSAYSNSPEKNRSSGDSFLKNHGNAYSEDTPKASTDIRKPSFEGHNRFIAALHEVFRYYQAPDEETRTFIAATLLVRNASVLLSGVYGAGKTQLIHLIRKVFFTSGTEKGDFGQVTCTQDLTPMDLLFSLDLARLLKGEEIVTPRSLLTARFKFVNEVRRANSLVYNALLSLLSERQVTYRDQFFTSPDYLCFLDENPSDSGSSDIPRAFLDRIDYSFNIRLITHKGLFDLHKTIGDEDAVHSGQFFDLADAVFQCGEIETLWDDVNRVAIDAEIHLLTALIAGYLQKCVHVDRAVIATDFQLPCGSCKFKSEACAALERIPGTRFISSMLKLAQARAWISRRESVEVEDIFYALPYSLAHRLECRPGLLNLYANTRSWIVDNIYRDGIQCLIPRWRQAIHVLRNDPENFPALLAEMAPNDRSVSGLKEFLSNG